MKLVLFTPVCKASSIGAVSLLISNALMSQGHEVLVVRTENEHLLGQVTHDFSTPPIVWTDIDQVLSVASKADALIYQIGNHYDYHCGCLEWLPRLGGVVCLHDFFVGHLFRAWAENRRTRATEILCTWYGDTIAQQYFSQDNTRSFVEETKDSAPMTEWICSMAHGIVTHSSWDIKRVLHSCPGPVHTIALCYKKGIDSASFPVKPELNGYNFNLLTIGDINPNKRADSVIKAIGSSPLLQKRVTYHLAGYITPHIREELSNLAAKLSVNLSIYGGVTDEVLAELIKAADVISCLRWPALEAASASLIEALLNGKATIVTHTGCYSEIPDSCVMKIDPENEIPHLQSVLETLYADSNKREALALQGYAWAKKTFTVENYTHRLVESVISTIKCTAAIHAVDYFCKVIHPWSGNQDLLNDKQIIEPLRIFESE